MLTICVCNLRVAVPALEVVRHLIYAANHVSNSRPLTRKALKQYFTCGRLVVLHVLSDFQAVMYQLLCEDITVATCVAAETSLDTAGYHRPSPCLSCFCTLAFLVASLLET